MQLLNRGDVSCHWKSLAQCMMLVLICTSIFCTSIHVLCCIFDGREYIFWFSFSYRDNRVSYFLWSLSLWVRSNILMISTVEVMTKRYRSTWSTLIIWLTNLCSLFNYTYCAAFCVATNQSIGNFSKDFYFPTKNFNLNISSLIWYFTTKYKIFLKFYYIFISDSPLSPRAHEQEKALLKKFHKLCLPTILRKWI
jgi:hypothetical protein